MSGLNINEDGDVSQNDGNSHNGIDFAARLQQFEHMQHRHRLRSKEQTLSRTSPPPQMTASVFYINSLLPESFSFNYHHPYQPRKEY